MRRTVGTAAAIVGAAAIVLVVASCGSDSTGPHKVYIANLSPANEVDVVMSGREALDKIATGARYDVILCDLMMPDLTGMDVFDLHCNKHIRMHGGEIACVKGLQGARGYLGGVDAEGANALHD